MKRANNGAVLNFDLCDLQKNPGIMSCILIRYKNLEMIQPLVRFRSYSSFCAFGFGPLVAKQRIRLDRNLVCELHLPSGTYRICK
jgi:hypothetical protein